MSRVRFCIFDAVLAVSLCCFAQLVEAEAQKTDPSEVHALRAIKHSLIDRYENLKSWNKGDPCLMKWKGVSCFNTTKADNYLHVQKLHLLNMNLSGSLSPELGRLSYLTILDFMWNEISGSIPKEIGQIKSLELLILNRNKLSDSLPDELGYLPNLILLQIDDNNISGPLPKSFANLEKIWHLHMNNNSISGEIPTELSRLPVLIHLLLDNNNLSGNLPSELSQLPSLNVLQLDNNHFDGRAIPASYSNMSNLVKLSLRNCSLQGRIPDLSGMPHLKYLDLSWNHLTGSIPSNILINITTIDLSYNNLDGSIPTSFSSLPQLQKLSIENNSLSGVIPSTIWQNMTFESKLFLYFQNNLFSNISGDLNPPVNVVIRLSGNPVCENVNQLNRTLFCGSQTGGELGPGSSIKPTNASSGELEPGSSMKPNASSNMSCPTDDFFECVAVSPSVQCFCAAPLGVWYRLKSPSFSYFPPYRHQFEEYLASNLQLQHYQLAINSCAWEAGPRLSMYLKIFPVFDKNVSKFNDSEITRIEDIFTGWSMPVLPIFGPYELISFTLLGPYTYENLKPSTSGITKGVLAGILLGAVAGAISLSAIISILIMRRCTNYYHEVSRRRLSSKISIKIDGVKDFTFREMASATDNFSESTQVGQGGYGNVYKGILADGTVVAIKRAREGSLQGKKEFLTEIELLSRLHHRNLVSLLGYCSEEEEQLILS